MKTSCGTIGCALSYTRDTVQDKFLRTVKLPAPSSTLIYKYDGIKKELIFYTSSSTASWWGVAEVDVDVVDSSGKTTHQLRMEPKFDEQQMFRLFHLNLQSVSLPSIMFGLMFNIRGKPISKNYDADLRDSLYSEQLWSAAVDRDFTDVEFQVGDKIFPAHRALLAARCPALAGLASALVPVEPSPTVVLLNNVDPAVFEEILYFLYTGVLRTGPLDSNGVFAVAKIYKIETLLNFRPFSPPKSELLSASFQSLFLQ